jgi:transglutaminase-like putative cysteine protease
MKTKVKINIRPEWLSPTQFLNYQHPSVQRFIADSLGAEKNLLDKAVRLYYAVRDGIRYDPYRFRMDEKTFVASNTVTEGAAYCVPKALLYAACLRAIGIPARVGFADVKNHLTTKRLLELTGTDVFSWHGYVSVLLNEKWVKATPAFNIEMCDRFNVLPLEFDGITDSLMHPYNAKKERHMEYIRQHGEFDDLPYVELKTNMLRDYPRLLAASEDIGISNFEREAVYIE